MKVRDLMTSPVQVIGPDAPAWEAVGLMRTQRIRRLPVVDGDKLLGIVTWTDLIRIRPPALGDRWIIPNLAAGVLVRHLMTASPITVSPDSRIEQVAALMRERKVGGLPVVEHGRLVGIITESDLFEAFVETHALGPHEVRLHVPVLGIIVQMPRIVSEMVRIGLPILSLHTLRIHGNEAIDLVVRHRDEALAREALRDLGLDIEAERLLEHSKAR